jgi:hypothetical protein
MLSGVCIGYLICELWISYPLEGNIIASVDITRYLDALPPDRYLHFGAVHRRPLSAVLSSKEIRHRN